jgi:exopolyphosphatase/guanosine-5'-triphosphate,3'-diphosphate pyrophosphatase
MVIGRFLGHELQTLDRLREPICLAAGLDDSVRLTEEAQLRALTCLERFGQRLDSLKPTHVRAVGTNTLRRAKNGDAFRERAALALGHPIEVVSGQEEARLIYLGVAHTCEADATARLVVDIGGGSTEVIRGERFRVTHAHSLHMGCVRYSQRFFSDGRLRRESFREAEIAAQLELRAIRGRLRGVGWEDCIGSSGTINAVREILRANGWSDGEVTLPGMKKLRKALVASETVDSIRVTPLKPDRARVLPGGLAILIGVFKALKIDAMSGSSGALREGVLYDLVGRIRHEDVREATIRAMVRRYHVDVAQAVRVESTALNLLAQVGEPWIAPLETGRTQLRWASRLHEIGLAISYSGHHKHGRYLVTHSDMPGFSEDDQLLLAALVGSHRRKLGKQNFEALPEGRRQVAARLGVILRLAVLLNRSRAGECSPRVQATLDTRLELTLPPNWLAAHPLTRADLEQEATSLRALKLRLAVREAPLEVDA